MRTRPNTEIPTPRACLRTTGCRSGFSLVEMMAVIAIIAILLVALVPSIAAFAGGSGRAGAVTLVMNTFEQARAAALESGSDVYVLLWRRTHPEQDSLMVVRRANEWDGVADDYIPLTRWMKMPKGVILKELPVPSIANAGVPSGFNFTPPGNPKPGESFGERMSVLRFNPSGAVTFPSAGNLYLFLTEGVRDSGGNEAQIGSTAQSPVLERLLVSRFTGRTQLDVTATSDFSPN